MGTKNFQFHKIETSGNICHNVSCWIESVGEMENTAANQLPEVDSLPDGFVESSAEPVAPPTPTLDKESDYKDSNFSTTEPSNDPENESLELLDSSVDRVEKTQKPRTFPVPLSEKDGFDSSGESPKVTNKGCSEPGEGALILLKSSNSVSET